MAKLIGNNPSQIPTNGDLGSMAFEDRTNYITKGASVHQPYRNIIINGDMSIAQRGTSATGLNAGTESYNTVDRWQTGIFTTSAVFTQSQSTDVPTGQGFAKSLKMDCTTADASLASAVQMFLRYKIEGQNLQYLNYANANAKSLTLSFWVKSNKTGTYIAEILRSGRTINKSYTIDSASTWEKKTITFEGDTGGSAISNNNSAGFSILFFLGNGSNMTSGTLQTTWGSYTDANRAVGQVNLADSTANEFYITGVQLEVSPNGEASDFEFLPHDVNLQRCQRYYTMIASGTNKLVALGGAYSASNSFFVYYPKVTFRATPSIDVASASNYYSLIGHASASNVDDFFLEGQTTNEVVRMANVTDFSGTTGSVYFIQTNNANAYVGLEAEL